MKDCWINVKNNEINWTHTEAYYDSSFASNKDLSAQLGLIILMLDKNNATNILHCDS